MGAVDALRERSAVALPASDAARPRRSHDAPSRQAGRTSSRRCTRRGARYRWMTLLDSRPTRASMHTSEFRVPAFATTGDHAIQRRRIARRGARAVTGVDRRPNRGCRGVGIGAAARAARLSAHASRGRTKEQVGLVFWPDASAPQVRNNFHVTLHRLRKGLGNANWVSLTGDRYRVDPAIVEELDAVAFEQEVASARRALVRGGGGRTSRRSSARWPATAAISSTANRSAIGISSIATACSAFTWTR